jgi:hypothetical protein
VDGKPLMAFSGTWSLEGRTLKWRYESSSNPAIPPGYTDSDEITSVNATELNVVSTLSRKKRVYAKVK